MNKILLLVFIAIAAVAGLTIFLMPVDVGAAVSCPAML